MDSVKVSPCLTDAGQLPIRVSPCRGRAWSSALADAGWRLDGGRAAAPFLLPPSFFYFFLLALCAPYCPLFPLSSQVIRLLGLPRLLPAAASFGLLFDSSGGEPHTALPCIF
jgi:hypothetical protein